MRTRNRFVNILALAGIAASGMFGAQQAQAQLTQSAAVAASKAAKLEDAKVQQQAPKHLRGRFDRMSGGLSNRMGLNQRQKRKNARRAFASGDKRAFA